MDNLRQHRTSSAIAMALLLGSAVLAGAGCNRNATDTAAADTVAKAGDANSPPAPTSVANPAPGTGETAMAGGTVDDMQFYQEAMMGDHKEIAASQLEIQNGSSADVKQVAQKIMADHTALDKKLMAAGGSMPSAMSADTGMGNLQGKSGADLDRAFVTMMVADHQEDIPKFENAARNASTPMARKLAADALPTLRDHLQSVQKLQ